MTTNTRDPETTTLNRVNTELRHGGYVIGAGGVFMLIGAILKRVTGTDLDAALTEGSMVSYLSDVIGWETALFSNLSFWIAGALFIGVGGYLLSLITDDTASRVARAIYLIGPALAVTSFVLWMALLRIAGGDPSEASADALGFISSRLDWIATILIAGIGPLLISVAGRRSWVPRWLHWLGLLAGVGAVVVIVAMYTGGLSTYAMVLVPVGIAWTIGAAATAIKQPASR